MNLSSLVARERLQEIVDTALEANPLSCPPIENRKCSGLPPSPPIAAQCQIQEIDLESALDPKRFVWQKLIRLVDEFRERVARRSESQKRTLMEALSEPIVKVEHHDPPSIWFVELQWEASFDTAPINSALPVKWIEESR